MGAFDHLEWTYDEAFEQLFGLRRGNFPGGGCLSFDLTGTLQLSKNYGDVATTHRCSGLD